MEPGVQIRGQTIKKRLLFKFFFDGYGVPLLKNPRTDALLNIERCCLIQDIK